MMPPKGMDTKGTLIPKYTATAAAAIWPASLTRGEMPFQSSIIPTTRTTRPPASSPFYLPAVWQNSNQRGRGHQGSGKAQEDPQAAPAGNRMPVYLALSGLVNGACGHSQLLDQGRQQQGNTKGQQYSYYYQMQPHGSSISLNNRPVRMCEALQISVPAHIHSFVGRRPLDSHIGAW